MKQINLNINAYILTLYPQSTKRMREKASDSYLQVLSDGLAQPSFWTRNEITKAVTEATRIWIREAKIGFILADISQSSLTMPASAEKMWPCFLNNLHKNAHSITVAFVHELPSNDGGWGGGKIAIVSGKVARSGLSGFAGRILAHEIGHILIDSGHHSDSSNLMYGYKHPKKVNPGMLKTFQIDKARITASKIT